MKVSSRVQLEGKDRLARRCPKFVFSIERTASNSAQLQDGYEQVHRTESERSHAITHFSHTHTVADAITDRQTDRRTYR